MCNNFPLNTYSTQLQVGYFLAILRPHGSIGGGGTEPRNLICTTSVNHSKSKSAESINDAFSLSVSLVVPGDARPGAAVVPVDPGAVPARPLVAPANGAVIIIKSIEQ